MATKKRQSKKGEEQIEYIKWDKKAYIKLGITLFLGFLLFALIFFDLKRFYIRNSDNWLSTEGEIRSIENIIGVNQSRNSNGTNISGYKIRYSYQVDTVLYRSELILDRSTAYRFVDYIRKQSLNWQVEVYYKKDNPQNSYLNMDRQGY